ncbi:hypothetical protein [Clostridium perfringens]|uniref:hypothetical protein n=1 Tax=Clostridium perfringens TaxID=1502 RepID=UPI0024BC349A|nr:hypothetical protein [Clostridium perfringens]MDK0765803.1 hypothetical protein [Clostridium perfringens]
MKNLVFVSLAYISEYNGSVNMDELDEKTIDIYLKNSFVCLKTIKKNNPFDDVAVVVNFEIDIKYRKLFEENEINIYKIDYDSFNMPKDFKWSLAFFKLCSLKYVVNNLSYKNYLQLDSDVVCIGNLKDCWEEINEGLMMLSGPFTYNHPLRKLNSEVFLNLYGENARLVKWGSGFIGANQKTLKSFIEKCEEVYIKLKDINFNCDNSIGDEFITSAAAYLLGNIRDAQPYMNVYWTRKFYLVSTNYKYDPIVLIHLPDEKRTGLIYIYEYFCKYKKLPSDKILYKILGFPKTKRPKSLINFYIKIKNKLI